MVRVRGFLKRLVGRLKTMSSLVATLGAMLIPIAVVLWQEPMTPAKYWAGIVLMVLGVTSFIRAWVIVIREERRKHEDLELRIRREKTDLILLAHMADALGVDMDKVRSMLEDKLDGD